MNPSTDASWADVLSYQFFAPAPYPGVIRRDGILQRIAQSASASVILLQAPAGHGKSTALQQLKDAAEADGRLTGWLTFGAGDNDPRRFFMQWQMLVADLVTRAGNPLDDEPGRDANSRYRSDGLVQQLCSLRQPVALFLDEFQTLTDKTVLAFFKSLFENLPEQLRVFLGSRALPDVGLARLVVNNRALIVHGENLRFTPQEVERFFAAAGDLDMDLDEIDAIYQRTEGWPAALQLFRLTLGSPAVRRSLCNENARVPRELAEYLAENVLALQPPRIQKFLMHTSQLTRLCAALCDEVLGWTDSHGVLLQLERSGMFLRCIDPQAGWFKYHTLFSSMLAEQLRTQSPAAADQVHRSAARWYMKNGFFEDAVHHAMLCGEHALAADALNRWSTDLIASAHLRTVEYWSERIPFAEITARPDLAIKCAYALVFLRRRRRVKPLLEVLKQRAGTGTVLETTDPRILLAMTAILEDDIPGALAISGEIPAHQPDATGFAAFELGAAANLQGYCALTTQDFALARDCLAQARAYNGDANAAFSRGYTIAVSAAAMLLQGQVCEALERLQEELAERTGGVDSHASAAAFCCYVWALYEANDLATAESLFAQNHDIISGSTRTDFLTVAFLSMARVHEALGQSAKAETLLDEAESIGRENSWSRLVSTVQWERVRRALQRGATDQATAIAGRARVDLNLPPDWIPLASDVESQELGEIRLALALGDLDAAAARIHVEFKRQRGRVLRQIKLHLLLAVHGSRSANKVAAQRNLRAALRLARGGGLVRCILDEGGEVVQLLRDEHEALLGCRQPAPDSECEFIETLLQVAGANSARDARAAETAQYPLTEREREMLVLLANGISNKGMANRLFVTENTVKFHLKNIYSKLSVASRVQAVTAARQIGIVQR